MGAIFCKLQLTEDVFLDFFQLALLPQAFFPLPGEGEDDVEVHMGTGEETIGVGFRLQIDHLPGIFHHEGVGGQGRQKLIFLGRNVGEDIGQRRCHNVFGATDDLNAHGIEGHFFLSEVQLQQYTQVGIQVDTLVIGVENEVAQRVENGLAVVEQLIIFGNVGMVADNHISAKFQEF